MTEPIRIPLQPHQAAQFAAFDAQTQQITNARNSYLAGIVSCTVDPKTIPTGRIDMEADAIVVTFPPDISPPKVDA